MKVRFKRPFFIEGYRFMQGWNEVPDKFRGRLPPDAEIEGEKKDTKPEAGEKVTDHGERPKLYLGVPKVFKDEDAGTEIDREVVLKAAVADFLAEDPAHSIDTWNDLKQDRRKALMQDKAKELLQPMAA